MYEYIFVTNIFEYLNIFVTLWSGDLTWGREVKNTPPLRCSISTVIAKIMVPNIISRQD